MNAPSGSPRPRVAVIGGGAVGGLVAAFAAEAGLDVTLCVRTPLAGAPSVATGGGPLRSAPRLASRPDEPGLAGQSPADWVLVTTKAQDTAGAADWLRALCGPGTAVAVLQNGVGHAERVAPLLPPGTDVLPVLVYVSAERTAPGRITHHTGDELHVPRGPLGERFARLMTGTRLRTVPVPDFPTAAWRKLLTNVAANPITALPRQRIGVFADPGMARLAEDVPREAVAVARTEGAKVGAPEARGGG